MRQDAGVDGDAQRLGQLAWMLFLKIYSDLELETELSDSKYTSPTPKHLRWEAWADADALGKDALRPISKCHGERPWWTFSAFIITLFSALRLRCLMLIPDN